MIWPKELTTFHIYWLTYNKRQKRRTRKGQCNYCHASTNRGNQWCSRKQQCCWTKAVQWSGWVHPVKDVINPNIELNNRFSVLENEQVNVDKLGATSTRKLKKIKNKRKRKAKLRQKKTTNDAASSKPMEGGQAKAKQKEERQPQQQRKTVVVAGDSIIKYVKGWELSNNKQNVAVKSFSGATSRIWKTFSDQQFEGNHDKLVIHVGTNDIRSSTPQDIADEITEVAQQFKQESRNTK